MFTSDFIETISHELSAVPVPGNNKRDSSEIVFFTLPSGMEIFLRCRRSDIPHGMLEASISGYQPMLGNQDIGTYERRYLASSIRVSISRGPVTVAKEITRRLLPDAIPAFRKAVDKYEEHTDKKDSMVSTASALASVVSGHTCGTPHKPGQFCTAYGEQSKRGFILDGNVSLDGEVEIRLSRMSAETARRVLAALVQ